MRRPLTIVLAAACLTTAAGCKHGTDLVTATLGNMIYGGLSEMGDTSRPANERRAAAMIDGSETGRQFGQAITSQLPP